VDQVKLPMSGTWRQTASAARRSGITLARGLAHLPSMPENLS
jgi:hypothetical protein